jgi:hypothetical protein
MLPCISLGRPPWKEDGMKRSRRSYGAFTVSGPFEQEHPVPNIGAGISCAQTFASRHRKQASELTYYVRSLTGEAKAMVTLSDGVIFTAQMATK